jgi:hypothetical protein
MMNSVLKNMKYFSLSFWILVFFFSLVGQAQQTTDKYLRLMNLETKDTDIQGQFMYNVDWSEQIKIGSIVISKNNFKIRVAKVKDLYDFTNTSKDDENIIGQNLLLYSYPKNIFSAAASELEFIIKYNEKTIIYKLDDVTLDDVRTIIDGVRLLNGQVKSTTETIKGKLAYNGYFLVDDDLSEASQVTFCVRQSNVDKPELGTMACLESVPVSTPVATVNSETAKTQDTVRVSQASVMSWVGQNKNVRLEINTQPPKVSFIEVLPVKNNLLKVTGEGALPIKSVKLIKENKQLVTAGDGQAQKWTTEVKKSEPWLDFKGPDGGFFRYDVATEISADDQFVFVDKNDLLPTYHSRKVIRGRKSNKLVLSSTNGRLSEPWKGKLLSPFEWTVDLPLVEENNELVLSGLTPDGQKQTYKVSLDRAYPGDFSLRGGFTRAANSDFISVAELAGSYWFEDFLNLRSPFYFQKFGLTTRYLTALSKYPTSTLANSAVSLAEVNLGLRMRSKSGIWGRDAGGGVSLEYQDFALDNVSFPTLGMGFFWAMPIPQILGSSLDNVSYLRHPKWLDLEAVYYPLALKSDFTMKPTFNFNLTTKIAMSAKYFGDVGVSYRSYNYQMTQAETKLSATYFVLGLGARF